MFYKLFLFYCVVCFVQCQEEDEQTCTLDGFKGRCVEQKRCSYLIQVFQERKKPQICFFRGDVAFVCCTDCKLVNDINDIVVDPQRGFLYKDGRGKSWDYCLDQLKSLPYNCKNHFIFELMKEWNEENQCHDIRYTVVGAAGGQNAERGEFPHMALLGYGTEESGMQWLCGGTLINSRFILTAGHCISSSTLGSVTKAALGILRRSDPEAVWKKYSIIEIIKHPEYNPPSKYNDIALLQTDKSVRYSELIMPACLPNPETRKLDYALAAGWGALGYHREVADTLQKVILRPFTEKECSTMYEPNRVLKQGFNSTTQICWGNRNGNQDTCEGDSGGPLHMSSGCVYDVIGVTSFGPVCGFKGQAGMYTRVAYYLPWIESVAWP